MKETTAVIKEELEKKMPLKKAEYTSYIDANPLCKSAYTDKGTVTKASIKQATAIPIKTPIDIRTGENTHHHDHSITPQSFNVINIIVNNSVKPIQLLIVAFLLIYSPSSLSMRYSSFMTSNNKVRL